MPRRIQFEGQVHEFPDDVTDAEISAALEAIPAANAAAAPQAKTWADVARGAAQFVGDVGIGAAKKLAETGVRGGALLRQIPGVEAVASAFPEFKVPIDPTNTAQRLGGTLEQVAEIAAPSRALTKIGERVSTTIAPAMTGLVGPTVARAVSRALLEGAGAAGLAAAQGAGAGGSLVSGALGAAIPGAGEAVRGAREALQKGALKQTVRALGPTKERYKAVAERLAPEMLKRGVRGSRESIQARAQGMLEEVGPKIDDAITQYADRPIDATPVMQALEQAKDAFRTVQEMPLREAIQQGLANRPGATIVGNMVKVPVVFEVRPVRQLESLQGILRDLGPTPRVDQLVAVRRAWDDVVSQAGGFQHRAPGAIGIPLREQTEAWAKREASNAIRKILNSEVPELGSLNKEYAFWKGLDDVLTQTLQRTQPHGKGVGRMIATGAGQAVGAAAIGGGVPGALGGAVIGGKIADKLTQVFQSPRWQLVSANLKNSLADALASGNKTRIAGAVSRLAAIEAGSVGQ